MSVTDSDPIVSTTKPWYTSKTIWGALIAAVSPLIAIVGHFTIDPDTANAIASVAATVGGLIAVYGRTKAVTAIAPAAKQ